MPAPKREHFRPRSRRLFDHLSTSTPIPATAGPSISPRTRSLSRHSLKQQHIPRACWCHPNNVAHIPHALCRRDIIIMASFTRFAPRWSSSPSSSTPPIQWARALGLVMIFASKALASPEDELPEPTLVPNIWLPNLDGAPHATPTPQLITTPDSVEDLIKDTRIRFWEEGKWTALEPAEHELRKRTVTASVTTTLEIPVSTADSTTLVSSTSSTASATSTSTESSTTASSSPLPSFFDGGLSNNFTSSTCPTFIDNMITAEEFQTCYPISLLLQVRPETRYQAAIYNSNIKVHRAQIPSSKPRSPSSASLAFSIPPAPPT